MKTLLQDWTSSLANDMEKAFYGLWFRETGFDVLSARNEPNCRRAVIRKGMTAMGSIKIKAPVIRCLSGRPGAICKI